MWLAIHSNTLTGPEDADFAALVAKLLGGGHLSVGAKGFDHIGRLLASEIAQNASLTDDLLDTLRLVGSGRHPAVPEGNRLAPAAHVARALALCGRTEAIDILCAMITIDRGSGELAETAAVQAVAAAVEAHRRFPDVLPAVLETLAAAVRRGEVDRNTLAPRLASELVLPAPLIADESGDEVLLACANALSDPLRRQQMLASQDDSELFVACWAEAAVDIRLCPHHLLQRYDRAGIDGNEDVPKLLRAFARFREGQAPMMRPIWLRILSDALVDSTDRLNVSLVAELFHFPTSSGLRFPERMAVPADEAFPLLLEIERRLRNETLMAELIAVGSMKSAEEIRQKLLDLIIANQAGRSGDALLPFVNRLTLNSIAAVADADFTKTDASTRAAIVARASAQYAHGPKVMVRVVAAIQSIDELLSVLLDSHKRLQNVDPLLSIACALRPDRLFLWRRLLLATTKDKRQLGLRLLSATLKVIDETGRFNESAVAKLIAPIATPDSHSLRSDAADVLDEYAAAQSKKKSGDDLKHHLYMTARELACSPEDLEAQSNSQRAALVRLCTLVSERTGIDRSRFILTPPQPPQDRGSHYAEILGEIAPRLIQEASQVVEALGRESLDHEQQLARFKIWFDGRSDDLRAEDASERMLIHYWFVGPGNWQYFQDKVLRSAEPLMSAEQLRRMAELRPTSLKVSARDGLHRFFQSLDWITPKNYDKHLLTQLDWYESVLANLPESIQRLGPLSQHVPAPHPPHEQAIAYVFTKVTERLRARDGEPTAVAEIRQRLWPLLWWASSFGRCLNELDAAAMGAAVSCGQASLADLVWYLVQPDYAQRAGQLIRTVKHADNLQLTPESTHYAEIIKVLDAVAEICREQQKAVDSSLPATLANSWSELPVRKDQNRLRDVLSNHPGVDYQSVGRTTESQSALASQVSECLSTAAKSWTIAENHYAPQYIKFDVLDAWLKSTTADLRELHMEGLVSENNLLRLALDQPLLMRCVLDALGWTNQLEAAIWLLFHAGISLKKLAITLCAETGHAHVRHSELSVSQITQRLLDQYAPEIGQRQEQLFSIPVEDATIRHRWKRSAIDSLARPQLDAWLKAMKAVTPSSGRLQVEGLLAAMNGELNAADKRKQLEASIKDRPNLALLQLAVLPLPVEHAALIEEISYRLSIFEALALEGRKRKSADAKESMRRALDQARRTLADNAGLADPSQLDWLSGEAIAKELTEFERIEADDCIIQLHLRSHTPQLLVTKCGKPLKALPAAFKKSETGKRLVELQTRLKNSLRDARAVLESAMIEQRQFDPATVTMMMQHPIVRVIASELVLIMDGSGSEPAQSAVLGLPSEDGRMLIALDGTLHPVLRPVRIAHPLTLDRLGVLADWQRWMTDRAPPAFPQLEREFARARELDVAGDGKRVMRHAGVRLANEDQAFRILQAHGWQDNREIKELCRTFTYESASPITALLVDELSTSGSLGMLEFRDAQWNQLSIADVPEIVLSEAIRDIDRTVSGTQTG